jgi:hypothetical protein
VPAIIVKKRDVNTEGRSTEVSNVLTVVVVTPNQVEIYTDQEARDKLEAEGK